MNALFLLLTFGAYGQVLTLAGACPGPVLVEITGLTPGARVGVLEGIAGAGADVFAGVPLCAAMVYSSVLEPQRPQVAYHAVHTRRLAEQHMR